MRNQKQQQHLLLLYSLSNLISSILISLLLNAALITPASSTFCSVSANQTNLCSSSNVSISFPFFSVDECDGTQSSFAISNCEPWSAHPDWPGFTKGATKDNRLNSTVVSMSTLLPSSTKALNRTGSYPRLYSYINLTWSSHLLDQSKNVCTSLASPQQISDYIPQSIDLQDFANSAFQFDPSNIILLFHCNPYKVANSLPYKNSLVNSSAACTTYESVCKPPKDEGYNCYQHMIPNPSKELSLPPLMNTLGCKKAMFFVALYPSLSVSVWAPGLIRLNWSIEGVDGLASTFQACAGCFITNGLCGYSSLGDFQCLCGKDKFTSTNCTSNDMAVSPSGVTALHQLKIVIIVVGIVTIALVMSLALLAMFCIRKRKKASTKARLPCSSQNDNKFWMKRPSFLSRKNDPILAKEISYKELVHATETFADKNILGDGGFGAVYRGVFPDGLKVAVKRLHHDNFRRIEHFYNEIKVLSNLNHPNLVKLFGFCTCEEEKELLLVFEYASQGTISDHLHGGLKPPMPWSLRLNIACDTAGALSYLHNAIVPPIYHRDVKTANILLDDGFHAKLGDFGLSKLVPVKATHISTSPQGTPGYLDPEYHQCYQLTDKSDVYSLGVVLMELISGKLAVDMSRERGEINLATLAVMKIQCGLLEELVDPKLEMKTDPSAERSIKRVVELAFECLHGCREDRPSMRCVAETLAHIRREYEEATTTPQRRPPSSPPSVFFSSGSSCPSSNLSSG